MNKKKEKRVSNIKQISLKNLMKKTKIYRVITYILSNRSPLLLHLFQNCVFLKKNLIDVNSTIFLNYQPLNIFWTLNEKYSEHILNPSKMT